MTPDGAAHYLAAMIDGEGTIGNTGFSRHIGIANTDPDIIGAIQRSCEVLGIEYRVVAHKKAQAHYRQRWDVIIGKQASMRKVLDLVPMQASCKVERLKIALSTYRAPRPAPEVLRRMYVDEQLGTTAISQTLGYNYSSIRYWLRKDGVPMRTHSESAKIRWAAGLGHGKHSLGLTYLYDKKVASDSRQ